MKLENINDNIDYDKQINYEGFGVIEYLKTNLEEEELKELFKYKEKRFYSK